MLINKTRQFTPYFVAPSQGRQITAVFSYYQRIAGSTATRLWLPDFLSDKKVEWAAVRHFNILQENTDFELESLDVMDLKKSMTYLEDMRAGGYIITLISLGHYTEDSCDDLQILDEKLQEEITRLIQFLYLQEHSQFLNLVYDRKLASNDWHYEEMLPHIAMAIGERLLLSHKSRVVNESVFFELLESLPSQHIIHDTGIGLTLPESTKENHRLYEYEEEERRFSFFNTLGTVAGHLMNSPHMRGYGDHLSFKSASYQRRAAVALMH